MLTPSWVLELMVTLVKAVFPAPSIHTPSVLLLLTVLSLNVAIVALNRTLAPKVPANSTSQLLNTLALVPAPKNRIPPQLPVAARRVKRIRDPEVPCALITP
jgi:hypothetical protein